MSETTIVIAVSLGVYDGFRLDESLKHRAQWIVDIMQHIGWSELTCFSQKRPNKLAEITVMSARAQTDASDHPQE